MGKRLMLLALIAAAGCTDDALAQRRCDAWFSVARTAADSLKVMDREPDAPSLPYRSCADYLRRPDSEARR